MAMRSTRATRTDDPPVIGIREVAALFDTSEGTVGSWRDRAEHPKHPTGFPDPDWLVSGNPVWLRGTIKAWARRTKRLNDDGTFKSARRVRPAD